jgi:hypothetical protein
MATLFNLKPFRFNLTDLNFMLDQIKFRPLFDAAGNAIINWDGTTPIYDSNVTATRVQLWDGNFAPPTVASGIHSAAEAIDAFGTSYASVTASQGLRDVTGLNNNLLLANHLWGSVDQPFSRSVPANFAGYVQPVAATDATAFYSQSVGYTPPTATTPVLLGSTTAGSYAVPGNVVDYTPRMISRTITTGGATPLQDTHGQVVHWRAAQYDNDSTYQALFVDIAGAATGSAAAAWSAWNSAIANKAAALAANVTAQTAVATAVAIETADLALLTSANTLVTANLAAEQVAITARSTAQANYTSAYETTVVPALAAEAAALAARDAVRDTTSTQWATLDAVYLQAVADRNAAETSVQPLQVILDAAMAASVTAHQATVDAQTAQGTAQNTYDQAVIDHANADATLASFNASAIVATTALTAAHNAAIAVIGLVEGVAVVADYGILAGGQHDQQDPTNGELFFGAVNPGVAPGNSFLAYFGQFFDHGLDFIDKGGAKITIPLAIDDPLYRAPGTNGPGDLGNTKITVTRALVDSLDANGTPQYINHSSPYIDQSQTYGSREQMTLLLREWVSTDGTNYHAGSNLLDGHTSHAWTNAFGESVTSTLPTLSELRAHLVATGRADISWEDVANFRARDASGHIADSDATLAGVQSTNIGQALLLDMNPHFDAGHISLAKLQVLDANITGITYGGPALLSVNYGNVSVSLAQLVNFSNFSIFSVGTNPGQITQAQHDVANEILLGALGDHYIAGDGRVNENIALTTIHHVFHEEHNFQVHNIQDAILAQDARAVLLGDASHSIAHDWQVAVTAPTGGAPVDPRH